MISIAAFRMKLFGVTSNTKLMRTGRVIVAILLCRALASVHTPITILTLAVLSLSTLGPRHTRSSLEKHERKRQAA